MTAPEILIGLPPLRLVEDASACRLSSVCIWSGKESDIVHAQILTSLIEPNQIYQFGVHSVFQPEIFAIFIPCK
jgi:hypothetical protein